MDEKVLVRPNVSVYLGDVAFWWKDFQRICEAEGTNASSKIAVFVGNYVARYYEKYLSTGNLLSVELMNAVLRDLEDRELE